MFECYLENIILFNVLDCTGSKLGSGTAWKRARVAAVCSTAAKQHHTPSSAAGKQL